jgi:hypothetical protein
MVKDVMELKNKRVLVVGLGKSGMAAALFLRDQGARVTVSDTRSAVALQAEIPTLLDAGIMIETGGHGLLTFRRQDLIVVSPGVPFDTPELKQVRAYGSLGPPIIGELELASRFLEGKVVAITGSNGKTTTTALLGKIFADAGGPTLVGGNIGTPVIELINESIRLSQGEADSSAALRNDKQKNGQQQGQNAGVLPAPASELAGDPVRDETAKDGVPRFVEAQWVVVTTWQDGQAARMVFTTARVSNKAPTVEQDSERPAAERVPSFAAVPVRGGWLVIQL